MYNHNSLLSVQGSSFSHSFRKPLYTSYCFSQLPATVARLLGADVGRGLPQDAMIEGAYETVILILLDGFGWEFFSKYVDRYPFLSRFVREGKVSQITSQFPSTTAAHITSLCTGEEVGQTGVYEWFYYEPRVDRMITPLMFSYAGDHQMATLLKDGFTQEEVLPQRTLYQHFKRQGISSTIFQHEGIAHTPYSQSVFQGATVVGYHSCGQGLDQLLEKAETPGKKYLYFYYGDIDAKGHRQGIDSFDFVAAMESFFIAAEGFVKRLLDKGKGKTALLVTADHGMVPVYPEKTIYLNHLIPNVVENFQLNRQGSPLVPAGSCRDFFLHVRKERLEAFLPKLQKALMGIGEVVLTSTLIEEGFFGSNPVSSAFLSRVGNVVILPYAGESVWWFEKHRFEQHFKAAHGGLTPQEMESIFLMLKI